jgi:small subunit ribosomal protein S6
MKSYESIIIVNSSLSEETLNKIVKRSEDFVTKNGGKLIETIQWGKRRLAYPIKKFQYGYYFIFKFEASPEIISEFEREFRLDENILRFMTFLKTPQEILAEERLREIEAKAAEKAMDTIENDDDLEDDTGDDLPTGSEDNLEDEAVESPESSSDTAPDEDVKKEVVESAGEKETKEETAKDSETGKPADKDAETTTPEEDESDKTTVNENKEAG